jgi:hypothetical protein
MNSDHNLLIYYRVEWPMSIGINPDFCNKIQSFFQLTKILGNLLLSIQINKKFVMLF